jgi:hypothetical protein
MKRTAIFCGLALLALVATACTSSPTGTGSVAMLPFFDQEQGLRGVVPHACQRTGPGNYDCTGLTPDQQPAVLVQQAVPGSRDDIVAVVLQQTGLPALPEPVGALRGRAFRWELYTFDAELQEAGPVPVRIDLALAGGDATSYLVVLVTLPGVYEAHAPLWDTVVAHTLYALEPLGQPVHSDDLPRSGE